MITSAPTKSDFDLTQILNGVACMAPSPFGIHQEILGNIFYLLRQLTEKNQRGKWFSSPLDVILEEDLNVVQPDLIFIKKENLSIFNPNGHIRGVPDLLVEVVSPGSVSRDTVEKFGVYETYGVNEYWIVFPEQKVVEVFSLKNGKYALHCSTENTEGKVNSVLFPDLAMTTKEVFG